MPESPEERPTDEEIVADMLGALVAWSERGDGQMRTRPAVAPSPDTPDWVPEMLTDRGEEMGG